MTTPIRIGVDVGGTFTKAVAIETAPLRLLAHTAVPTSHGAAAGVAEGVAEALRALLADLGEERERIALEQGVHRLRGREGDERDALTLLTEVGEQCAQRLGHAFGNARGGAV